MDSIVGLLVQGAEELTTAKYILIAAIALTFYDYLLTFNDEIRYVWRGRKTWISYLYMLNRILLIAYQSWEIYYTSNPKNSKTVCLAGYYVQVVLIVFFLLSSDIFITLRIYAISLGNRMLVAYFGTMALARLTLSLASSFANPIAVVNLPRIPEIDAFNLCGLIIDLRFKLVPNAIGTAFELSAFLVIIWYTYHNKSALKLSALIRTIAAEATMYFLVMVAAQTYVQISLSFTTGTAQQLSFLAYGLLNPVLTMRFAISLKRSADPEGGEEWQVKHFSTARFASRHLSDSEVSDNHIDIEMDIPDALDDKVQTREACEGVLG